MNTLLQWMKASTRSTSLQAAAALYIGGKGDLRKRVFQRKWKEYEGFSANYNCDRLVWFENYQDVVEVIARETQL